MDAPTLFNFCYVTIVYMIMAVVAKIVWDFMYKHRGKHFRILLIIFCVLDIGALAFGGWRIMCAAFLAGVYIMISAITQNNQNEKHLREQFAFYQDLAEKQAKREKEISIIRHDIANHMNVMEEMQKDAEGQELLRKLDKANRSMTGIPVLDCLIREKASVCEKEGIAFEREGGTIGETKITEYEFVSLFANLLDNAIEAAKETEEKTVKLSVEKQQGVLKITVSNSKLAERRPLENDFKTTKKDKKNHGLGSRIVRDIVEVHGGRVSYHDEGGQMRVVALMQE
jgi:signal transduction histidine kinase